MKVEEINLKIILDIDNLFSVKTSAVTLIIIIIIIIVRVRQMTVRKTPKHIKIKI
jgi:hypothetical protein